VNRLADLPTRRTEAWKYSDLRAAMDETVQAALGRDRADAAVLAALDEGGVIGALAAQMGGLETLEVADGASVLRLDRPRYANLEPRFLRAEVGAGATLTRIVVQSNRPDAVVLDAARVRLGQNARFRQMVLAEGAKLARIETHVSIEGGGAEVELNGVYLCAAGRHADLTSVVEHKVPDGQTRQLIKGVAKRGGRGVFQGKIVVAHAAQKTDARQYHHGMLLEAGAEIFAKPELLIHADDVQCAHGNTAGGIDADALFYLRARGVSEAHARALLIEAFLAEAIPDNLPDAVGEELVSRMRNWLGDAP
jgi:Fe-S cluster assembly protein SufD